MDEFSSRRGAETGQRGEKGGTGRGTPRFFYKIGKKCAGVLTRGYGRTYICSTIHSKAPPGAKLSTAANPLLPAVCKKESTAFNILSTACRHFVDSTGCPQGVSRPRHPTLRQSARSDIPTFRAIQHPPRARGSGNPATSHLRTWARATVSDNPAIRRPRAGVSGTPSAGSASDNRSGEFRPGTNPPKNPIVW